MLPLDEPSPFESSRQGTATFAGRSKPAMDFWRVPRHAAPTRPTVHPDPDCRRRSASTMVLGRTLEQWGFDVVVANDGVEAWERITGDQPPALAIVDWMMPRLDGIELCQRIRATPLPFALVCDPADQADQSAGSCGRPRGRRRRLSHETVRARRAPRAPSRRSTHPRPHREHQAAQRTTPDLQLLQTHPVRYELLGTGRQLHHGTHGRPVLTRDLPPLHGEVPGGARATTDRSRIGGSSSATTRLNSDCSRFGNGLMDRGLACTVSADHPARLLLDATRGWL